MLLRIMISAVVGMGWASMTEADSLYKYIAKVSRWNIVGWTDSAQISCGAATQPTTASVNYFAIYRQIWASNGLVPGSSQMSYWDMDIGTTIPQGTDVSVTVGIDDQFQAVLPKPGVVRNTTNPHVRLLSLDTEVCAFELGCADRPNNVILHALATKLGNAQTLRLSFSYKGGRETRTIDVSDFKSVKTGIDKCFQAIGGHSTETP